MMALLLCGLLLLSPADTVPVATPPPTEAEDVIEAVDLAPWDDLFSRMEDGEAWQRPSALVRSIAAGEEDPARLLAWLKELGLSGVSEAAGLCLVALVTGVLGALLETVLDGPAVPARRVLSVGLAAFLLMRLLPLIRKGLACLDGVLTLAEVTVPLMTGALLLLASPQGASVLGTLGELLLTVFLRWMQGSLVPLALSAGVLRTADFMGDSVLSAISRLLFISMLPRYRSNRRLRVTGRQPHRIPVRCFHRRRERPEASRRKRPRKRMRRSWNSSRVRRHRGRKRQVQRRRIRRQRVRRRR